jgi:glycosyltransferase involved in cell wall biosynthesis
MTTPKDLEPVTTAEKIATVPAITLILCTVERTDPLLRLFDSLLAQTNHDFEVVIVDQNQPGTLDPILARFKKELSLVHCYARRGLSCARNIGLAHCRGAIIGFPDDDCWYPPQLVETVVALFASSPDTDVFSGRTLDADGRESLGHFRSVDQHISKRNIWFTGNSNSLFVRATSARRVGGFDETLGIGAATRFQSGEEADLVLRLLASGSKAYYRRNLVVHHDQVLDRSNAAYRRATAYAPGFGRVLRLHYGMEYLVQRLSRTLASAAWAVIQLDFFEAKYKLLWAFGTVTGYFAKTHPQKVQIGSHTAGSP